MCVILLIAISGWLAEDQGYCVILIAISGWLTDDQGLCVIVRDRLHVYPLPCVQCFTSPAG